MQDNAASAESNEIVGIKNLEEEFDVELAKELAQAYLDDTSTIIARINEALENADQESLRSAAHMLKGCSRAIQAHKCEKASAILENNARDGNLVDAKVNVPLVAAAYEETEKFLKKYLE